MRQWCSSHDFFHFGKVRKLAPSVEGTRFEKYPVGFLYNVSSVYHDILLGNFVHICPRYKTAHSEFTTHPLQESMVGKECVLSTNFDIVEGTQSNCFVREYCKMTIEVPA